MRKLILKCFLCPGDLVLLTAALRDLHLHHPGQFLTDVRTSCPEIWDHNPRLTPLDERASDVEVLECHYPLINRCNEAPYHSIHGFIDYLNRKLGLQIQPTAFKGDIHLSPQEKAWFSQVHELTGQDTPFWIVAAGGKFDVTIKWWDTRRYQQVVDHFRGRIQFVQVGQNQHHHPRLEGVIDLRGRTDLRQLIRLMYHAQGVLGPVTSLMHLATAVEVKGRPGALRPCVVIAGGREPAHWEAYPGHQFIDTLGALPCCARGGCWRSRTVALGDGDKRDQPEHLCVDVVGELPRCMDLIRAGEVSRCIERYFDGGAIQYLSGRQSKAAARGVTATNASPLDSAPLTPRSARAALEHRIENLTKYPGGFRGRGIVICGGGLKLFTNAWVCIHMLRDCGCRLPVELWHLGAGELDGAMARLLAPLGVRCVDAFKVRKRHPVRILRGWELKAYAILHCSFKEVLLLDADNVPVRNPEYLFVAPQFKQSGAVFWPDRSSLAPTRGIWDFCGLAYRDEPAVESGQILVDKSRCWPALELALWFNEHSDFFYEHIYGDKDTFHLAFRKLRLPYAMPKKGMRVLEGTMCQHDFRGRRVFQHRNYAKWSLWLPNPRVEGFRYEPKCRAFLDRLRKLWDGRMSRFERRRHDGDLGAKLNLTLRRPITIATCMISCAERDRVRQRTLKRLAATDWGTRPVRVQIDETRGSDRVERIVRTGHLALRRSRDSGADYLLFLEDDLMFNRHLLHNLRCWAPLRNRQVTLASLYNPDVHVLACDVRNHALIVDPEHMVGTQGLILSAATVEFLLAHWDDVRAPLDHRIARLAARLGRPIYSHAPPLVQPQRIRDVRDGRLQRAVDFDPDWRGPDGHLPTAPAGSKGVAKTEPTGPTERSLPSCGRGNVGKELHRRIGRSKTRTLVPRKKASHRGP